MLIDTYQPFEHGVVESVGDFEPKLKMKISSGCDYLKVDGDGKYGRPNVKAIFTDDEGRSVVAMAEGVTELSEAIQGVLSGTAGEGVIPFKYSGESFNLLAPAQGADANISPCFQWRVSRWSRATRRTRPWRTWCLSAVTVSWSRPMAR